MDNVFYTPPTIQEMKRDNPEDHLPLIYDAAMDMLNMNTIYTGKSIEGDDYQYAFNVHVVGIKNGMLQGTVKTFGSDVRFWHPGKGEYVDYSKELQDYLLGFIKATKGAIARLKDY